MRAVISPARDEILDAVAANGPCTVMWLGAFLGRKPDSLYHHVRVLRRVGLLLETLSPNSQGRATAVYDVPGRPIFLRYELGDPRKVRAVTAYAGSALRIAHRRFAQGFKSDHAVVRGPARNLWAARWRGWLTQTELGKGKFFADSSGRACSRGRFSKRWRGTPLRHYVGAVPRNHSDRHKARPTGEAKASQLAPCRLRYVGSVGHAASESRGRTG